MYNTADNLEYLDITEELLSFDTVCGVEEYHQIFDEEYKFESDTAAHSRQAKCLPAVGGS